MPFPKGTVLPRTPLQARFWKRVKVGSPDDCWEWVGGKSTDGYGRIRGRGGVNSKTHNAHRVMWELMHGEIPSGMLVCHHCDNPSCVNPAHLFLGTPTTNNRDRARKGRSFRPWGDLCPSSKLSNEDARQIRRLYGNGLVTQRELAEKFGVNRSTIGYVVRGDTFQTA